MPFASLRRQMLKVLDDVTSNTLVGVPKWRFDRLVQTEKLTVELVYAYQTWQTEEDAAKLRWEVSRDNDEFDQAEILHEKFVHQLNRVMEKLEESVEPMGRPTV